MANNGTMVTKCFGRGFHLYIRKTSGMANMRRKMKEYIHRLHRRKTRAALRQGQEPERILPVTSWEVL